MKQTSTLADPAVARRLLSKKIDAVEMSTQPGILYGSRTVFLRIAEGGKKVVYEIPLEEWSRLNRDAIKTP